MPRRSPAVQKGGTTAVSPIESSEKEAPPRRSARTASRNDSSGTAANRSRRSTTAAQTAVSTAETRVTRSRSSTDRRSSTSPVETTRTRSSRETSLESPASRVKTTRRSTGRVNYQESEGEEDVTPTAEKTEEEEYQLEDDIEESDSEESNRSNARKRLASKSPPKIRSRGRGRPPKVIEKDKTKPDEEEEEEEEEAPDNEDEVTEEADVTDTVTPSRRHHAESEPEPVRRTRGTGRKVQNEPVPTPRSTRRSEKTPKENAESKKVPLPKSTRSSARGKKKQVEESPQLPADVESEETEKNKTDEKKDEMEITEPVIGKRKRKAEVNEEAKKHLKFDEESTEKDKSETSDHSVELTTTEDNSKTQKLEDEQEMEKDVSEKEALPEDLITSDKNDDLTSDDKMVTEESPVKDEAKEHVNSSDGEKSFLPEVPEKHDDAVQNDEPMEVDNNEQSNEPKSDEPEISPAKADDNVIKEVPTVEDTDINEEKETAGVEKIPIDLPNKLSQKDNKSDSSVLVTETASSESVPTVETEAKLSKDISEDDQDDQETPKDLSSDVYDATGNVEDVKEVDVEESKEQRLKEVVSPVSHEREEPSVIAISTSSSSEDTSIQYIPKEPVESASLQENTPQTLETSNPTYLRENNIPCNLSTEPSKNLSPETSNAVGFGSSELLSVNGANTYMEKSDADMDAIDMSKVSDSSASETEKNTTETSLPASLNAVECTTTKANGAYDSIPMQFGQSGDSSLSNRKYICNPSLTEETRNYFQSRMFSLVSYNLSAMSSESSAQSEKLLLEFRKTEADIICLQEIKQTYYSETLEQSLDALGYKGILCIPENRSRGLGTFYKTSSFNLIRQAGIPLQKVIDQDLETSSLENADKIAVRNFLQKCGHMLIAQLRTVSGDHTLTIANVLFPPTDIGTHALQMSSLVREVVTFADDITRPHVLCGSFNMTEAGIAYQLLREGYLNNEMIEELQQRKDVTLPGKDNDTLVNLLWKAFQHPSSNLRSCYAAVLGHELRMGGEKTSPDLLWYSSDSLETVGVLDVESFDENMNPIILKADIAYVC